MKKVLLVLLVLIVGGGVFAYLNYENGIRRGIEIAGSSALGTAVTVSGVSVSPFSGKGSIRGLTIANPEGFDAPYAIELGGLDIALNVSSLLTDVIEIELIQVDDANITYETTIVRDNIRALLANLPNSDAAPVIEASPDVPAAKKVIIRELRINNPQIDLHTRVARAPVPLPDLLLQDIGDQSNAVTVAEAARQILTALNRSLINEGVPNMDVLIDGARQQLDDGVQKVEETVEKLSNGVLNLLGQ
ncbi:MAG: AsmA family protein [Gammaproteobacteria bacterium]